MTSSNSVPANDPDSTSSVEPTAQSELRFEQAMSELEHVVRQLSQPNVNLDDALALYERGVGLAQRSRALIAHAETRVDHLRQNLVHASSLSESGGATDAPRT